MTKVARQTPAVQLQAAAAGADISQGIAEQQRQFLGYARRHVRGVARRARFASVSVAVAAILLTGGAAAYSILNTLAVRDSVTRQIAVERDDLIRALSDSRAGLELLVNDNVGRAQEDAKTFADLRQTLAKLQSNADSLTDAYAVISREQAQILAALDATKKQLESAQVTADRAMKAADDAQSAAAKAALPLDQVARIADAQRTVEQAVRVARTDLGEIQSSLTLIQESKERGLPRLAVILEEAEVARARLTTLVKDAAGLRDAMLTPAQQASSTDPQVWPERREDARAR